MSAQSETVSLPDAVAHVRVARMIVRRFRGIAEATLHLEPGTTFLVGENNAGKSSLLQALAIAVGSRQASSDDLHRDAGGAVADSTEIDVWLSPTDGTAFDDTARQLLGNVQREPSAQQEVVAFRTTLKPSREGLGLTESRVFLQPSRDRWVASATSVPRRAISVVDAHMLDASRDLLADLGARTSSWGRVVADLQIPDLPALDDGSSDPLGRDALHSDLQRLARQLRSASPVLRLLEQDLKRIESTQATVGRVELLPVPPSVDELARNIQVVLHQGDQLSLPLRFHGLGSRSLAALFVFQTLCSVRIGRDRDLRPHLLTLLEEPESHLHPQAVIALGDLLSTLPGQKIVATHSTHLVAQAPPNAVRIVRRTPTGSKIIALPPETAKRVAQFRRFVERPFGEIFFARMVVLADGTSERNALPVLLRPQLGRDAGGLGLSFVDCEGMDHARTQKLIDALDDLDIPWLLFVDNDDSGASALTKLVDRQTGQPLTVDHRRVARSGAKQIEQLLLDAGYHAEIEAVATEADATIAPNRHLAFLAKNKGWAAEAVARKAVAAGKPAHPVIVDLAATITEMLGRDAPAAPDGGVA